jgi:hypothetical protein
MKVQFPKQATSSVIDAIRKTMDGRTLGDLVSLGEASGDLEVKISKLGTSTLLFERAENGEFITFTLTVEKIAFAHKAFKDEVKEKLVQVIEKSGGKVLPS